MLLARFGQAGFVNPIHFSQQAFVYSIKETSILSACYSSINRKEVVARFAGISTLFAETESLKQVAVEKKGNLQRLPFTVLVPTKGIEPSHPCEWQILSLLRLPIPPHGLFSLWSLITPCASPLTFKNRAAILRIAGIPAKLHAKYFWENASSLAAVFLGQQHLSYQGEYFV